MRHVCRLACQFGCLSLDQLKEWQSWWFYTRCTIKDTVSYLRRTRWMDKNEVTFCEICELSTLCSTARTCSLYLQGTVHDQVSCINVILQWLDTNSAFYDKIADSHKLCCCSWYESLNEWGRLSTCKSCNRGNGFRQGEGNISKADWNCDDTSVSPKHKYRASEAKCKQHTKTVKWWWVQTFW